MGRFIVELAPGKYVEWSSVVDAPVTYVMTETELVQYVREEYGEAGVRELPARMERVKAKGTNALTYKSADNVIRVNRAGPNETEITREQIIAQYTREAAQ